MNVDDNVFSEKNVFMDDVDMVILGAIKEISENKSSVNNKALILYFIDKLQIEKDVVKQHMLRLALEEVVFMTADDL